MSASVRCLVVGMPTAEIAERNLRLGEALSVRFAELHHHFPPVPSLELVVAPLYCPDFDALELIDQIGAAGYRGMVRVVAPVLPNRAIVLRELRSHAARKGITVEMVNEG